MTLSHFFHCKVPTDQVIYEFLSVSSVLGQNQVEGPWTWAVVSVRCRLLPYSCRER